MNVVVGATGQVGSNLIGELKDTGNVLMSRILEQTLDDLNTEKVFIRPSYYFSLQHWKDICMNN